MIVTESSKTILDIIIFDHKNLRGHFTVLGLGLELTGQMMSQQRKSL